MENVLVQMGTGKAFLKNITFNLLAFYENYKKNEPCTSISLSDLGTFRMSPNIKVKKKKNKIE